MIKNVNLFCQNEKLFLSKKWEKEAESPNKIILNFEEINKPCQIFDKKEKINLDKLKIIKYEKYSKLIEDFYINKYGLKLIQENCFICHMKNFSSNELLYFENCKNLFYYLKYIFFPKTNKLSIPNKIFLLNQNELNKYKMADFASKIKFYNPKIICKSCFFKITSEKNIIQNIMKIFKDNDDTFLLNDKNGSDLSNNLNFVNCIEIKNDDLGIDNLQINTDNKKINNEKNILEMGKKSNFPNLKKDELNFSFLNGINIYKFNSNINENFINNNKNNNIVFNNNNLFKNNENENCNFINYCNDNFNIELNKINNYNFTNFNNINNYNIVINDSFSLKNKSINNNNNDPINKLVIQYINSHNNYDNKENKIFLNNNKFIINHINEKNINKKKEEIFKNLYSTKKDNNYNYKLNEVNRNVNQDEIYKSNKYELFKIKHLFSNNISELLLCLVELKEKTSNIIELSIQLRKQYDFLVTNFPNLFDIILCHQKSFFLLDFVASSEIINYISLSNNYISQRIYIISQILNIYEKKVNLISEEINEIKKLKSEIQNINNQFENNNTAFKVFMNKFLEILKNYLFLNK